MPLAGVYTKNWYEELRVGGYFCYAWRTPVATAMAVDHLYGQPFLAGRNITVDRIAVNITIAGAGGTAIRLGIYKNGTNLYPGALLLDAGTVAADGVAIREININQSLVKGWYFLTHISDGAPTLRDLEPCYSPLGDQRAAMDGYADTGWDVAQAYGALPDPFTGGGAVGAYIGGTVFLRVASLD